MLEASFVNRRYQAANILEGESRFGGEAVGGEVVFDGGAEEGAVGEEIEGDGRGSVEHRLGVEDTGEAIALDVWEM